MLETLRVTANAMLVAGSLVALWFHVRTALDAVQD